MPAEMLTAFLAFVNPMSLPRRHRNNGKAIVAVDLAERPDDHQAVAATLKARIEMLEADIAKLEATAAELMAAREATARIAGELAAFQARPWWRRLVG
jgi:cell division protein FtsB